MQEVVPEATHTSMIGKYIMAVWTDSASWIAVLLQLWHRLSLYLRFVEVLAAMVGLRVVLSLQQPSHADAQTNISHIDSNRKSYWTPPIFVVSMCTFEASVNKWTIKFFWMFIPPLTLCPSIITHVATQGSNIACMSDQVILTKLCQQLPRAQVLSS